MTTGQSYDITLVQREDFDLYFSLLTGQTPTPIDLSNATVEGHVRADWQGPLLATLDCEITDAQGGVVRVSLDGDKILWLPPGTMHYDVFVEIEGRRIRALHGTAQVEPAYTRP